MTMAVVLKYRSGPTTEMVSKRWHQTPVTIRRIRDHEPPNVLFEELQSIRGLRHPGLMLLLGVSATQHWESIQLIYEPIFHGSLHHRLHIMGTSISLTKRLLILQQICDALLFLHSKELLHCCVSSHAVHLVSTSRAKLGCLETLVEDNKSSKKVYRKSHTVPPSHWKWMAPWLAPECSRDEFVSTLSDVYSFCCLVWETCEEKLPWSHLDCHEISRMWQKETNSRMLPLGSAIPLHVKSFLKLGLLPDLRKRRKVDLQEILLMLKLVTAVRNSVKVTTSTPVPPYTTHSLVRPQHGRDTVKKTLKNRRALLPPPTLPPPPPVQLTISEKGSSDLVEYCDVENESPNENVQNGKFAFKPASHRTEYSINCQMYQTDNTADNSSTSLYYTPPSHRDESLKNCNPYSGFNSELRSAVAKPAEIANKEDNAAKESTVEVTGHPSSTSAPRYLHGMTFLACNSGLEVPGMGSGLDEIGGAKP